MIPRLLRILRGLAIPPVWVAGLIFLVALEQ
jgi:hypothetical protein